MHICVYTQSASSVLRARRLDLSLRERDNGIRRCGNINGKLDHPYNSLRNYTQSHKCPPCVKCPACAHTPGSSRRPCLEFSRGFIGTTSINQVRECGDIILYYIMNYEQNGKSKTERNAINKALYPANEKRKEYR